jgi:hypothetical protein
MGWLHSRGPFHYLGLPALLEVHLEESHGVRARYAPSGTDRNAWMYEQHCHKHRHPVDPAQRDAFASRAAEIQRGPSLSD